MRWLGQEKEKEREGGGRGWQLLSRQLKRVHISISVILSPRLPFQIRLCYHEKEEGGGER